MDPNFQFLVEILSVGGICSYKMKLTFAKFYFILLFILSHIWFRCFWIRQRYITKRSLFGSLVERFCLNRFAKCKLSVVSEIQLCLRWIGAPRAISNKTADEITETNTEFIDICMYLSMLNEFWSHSDCWRDRFIKKEPHLPQFFAKVNMVLLGIKVQTKIPTKIIMFCLKEPREPWISLKKYWY